MISDYAEEPNALIDYELQTSSNGTNSSLYVGVSIERSVSWSARITTSKGTSNMTWTQSAKYENYQNFTAAGSNETLWQSTTGRAVSQVTTITTTTNGTGADDTAELQFDYPISFAQAYAIPADATTANSTLSAVLDRSKREAGTTILSHLVYPAPAPAASESGSESESLVQAVVPVVLSTRQNGSCFYIWNNTYYEDAGAIDPADGTTGATSQWFAWEGAVGDREGRAMRDYSRFASAVDGYEPVLTVDRVSDGLINVPLTEVVTGPGINVLPGPSDRDLGK